MKTANLYTGIVLDMHSAIVPTQFIGVVKEELRNYEYEPIEGSAVYNDLGEYVGRYIAVERKLGTRKLRKLQPYETALIKMHNQIDRLRDSISNDKGAKTRFAEIVKSLEIVHQYIVSEK